VGNRVREGTIAADQLRQFLDGLDVAVLTMLRDTQLYVHLAARGATLWDIAPSRAERDLEQWQPILAWAAK
jgi:chromosome partitioning protein